MTHENAGNRRRQTIESALSGRPCGRDKPHGLPGATLRTHPHLDAAPRSGYQTGMTKSDPRQLDAGNVEPLRRKRPCPTCGKESDRRFFPFCCKRCADVDLNRWLSGSYAIPVVEEDGGLGGDRED